jgi:broad specificity phosphatase PhoE
VRRLLLVRHAATSATRAFAFPCDEPLDARGVAEAAGLRRRLPARCSAMCSPARRCVQTAAAAQLESPAVVPRLAECDFGSWSGRTLACVDELEAVAWMTDPSACPHGGESLYAFAARVGAWLDEQASCDGPAVAITHGGVVKVAIVHALGAPLAAFWQVDVRPLAITELHAHDGRWTVTRMNCMAEGVAGGSRADAAGVGASVAEGARS